MRLGTAYASGVGGYCLASTLDFPVHNGDGNKKQQKQVKSLSALLLVLDETGGLVCTQCVRPAVNVTLFVFAFLSLLCVGSRYCRMLSHLTYTGQDLAVMFSRADALDEPDKLGSGGPPKLRRTGDARDRSLPSEWDGTFSGRDELGNF